MKQIIFVQYGIRRRKALCRNCKKNVIVLWQLLDKNYWHRGFLCSIHAKAAIKSGQLQQVRFVGEQPTYGAALSSYAGSTPIRA